MTHRAFPDLSEEETKWEISASLEALRAFGPVSSFRAPYLRFPTAHLKLLCEHDIKLDSSQGKYKWSAFDSAGPASLRRIPASTTSSVIRLPSWLRNPWLLSIRSPVVLFVHPWEFVDIRKEQVRLDCRFRTGSEALGDLRDVIRLFKARGARFWRMDDFAASLPGKT